MPKMGAAGAAVGTLVSGIVNLCILFTFLLKDSRMVKLRIKDMFSWGDGFSKVYLSKCLPILCNELFYGVGQMLINVVIGRQAESAIAAMAAFRVLEALCSPFRRTGGCKFRGGGEGSRRGPSYEGISVRERLALLCPAITFVICSIGLAFNRPLLGLFGLGSEAMFYGKYMIMIYLAAGTIVPATIL